MAAPHRRRQQPEFRLGQAIEAENAHLPVGRDRRLAEDLGKPAGAVAPHHLHLEQAVLGMREAEPEGGILVVRRGDQWHAVGIARDRDDALQALHRDRPVELRQRRAEIEVEAARKQQRQQQQAGENAADGHHAVVPAPGPASAGPRTPAGTQASAISGETSGSRPAPG